MIKRGGAVLLIALLVAPAFGRPLSLVVRDLRTVKDGKCVVFNIGTAAHAPSTVSQVLKYRPDAKVTLWADAPLEDAYAAMIRRRFPDVDIVWGDLENPARTNAALFAAVDGADALLVASSSGITEGVGESARQFRRRTGRPVGAAAMGTPHPDMKDYAFAFFRDELAFANGRRKGWLSPVTDYAPDSVFDFDCVDEAGAEAFLKANGLKAGEFVCAIPGNRRTPRWIFWGTEPDRKAIAANAAHVEGDHEVLRAAIVEAVRRHGMKVLICAEQRSELDLIRPYVYDRLPEDVRVKCVAQEDFWMPDLALGVYRKSRLVFGIEMHSQVMALGSGIPAVLFHHPGFGTKADMWRTIGCAGWRVDLTQPGASEAAVAVVGGILGDPSSARATCAEVRAFLDRSTAASYRRAFPARVEIDTSPDRVDVPLRVTLKRVGTLRPRSTTEIRSSNLMLGCECSDRDLVDFEDYKRFLPPLGIKTIRLQGGWEKCEKVKGAYDFAWLDRQIDFALANGINPYLDTEYGNPLYPGCNGVDLGSKFPTGEVAVAAWDNWVDALSKHFRGRVRDWSMWNEPWCSAEEIAAQNIRTAKVIRRNIPDARIGAFSLGDCNSARLEACVKALGKDKDLFTWVVYHGYRYAPEQNFEEIDKIKAMLAREFPSAILRQGENGCPSEYLPYGWVLNGVPWSEYSQAKWILRRMLGDLGHDVMTDVFQIVDFYNPKRKIVDGVFNTKGLLRTGLDKKVVDIKLAYYAVQNLASVFDDRWTRVKDSTLTTTDPGIVRYEFAKDSGERLYLFWRCTSTLPVPMASGDQQDKEALKPVPVRPGDSFETAPQVFRVTGGAKPLADPVWVDVFSGRVYEFPERKVAVSSDAVRYMSVPVYDSPCFLTERSALDLQ